MWLAGKVLSLHLKLLDVDHPLTFEESKLRQIVEAHALIYLSKKGVSSNLERVLGVVTIIIAIIL